MILQILDVLSILLSALVLGVFWGPWLALSRSMSTFAPEVFVAVVHRMDRNLGTMMTILMPVTLLSILVVAFLSFADGPSFSLVLAGFALFVVTLIVTGAVEVPIVKQIRGWTASTLPDHWQQLRDRWVSFHIIRVLGGLLGLACLVTGALLQHP